MVTTTNRKIYSNLIALGIIQGTNFILPLVVMPFVIKRIGAEAFGVVAIAQVVMMFFTTISDYGFNLTATRDVSLNKGNGPVISKIFFTVLATRLLICAVLLVLLIVGILVIPYVKLHATLYLLAFVSVAGQSILMNWLFQGIERMKYITFISLLARLIFVVLVVCFIRTKADSIYFIFFTGVGNIIAGIVSIILAVNMLQLKPMLPSFTAIVAELKSGWHITTSNLSISLYMYINIVILRLFTNDITVGYYSVAEKIIMAGRQVLSVYFQGIYPQVCQLALGGKHELQQFLKKYYLPFLGLVLLGCIVLFIFPEPIIGVFLDHNQSIPSQYLRILSFVPFIICLNIPAYQVLLAHNEKKSLLKIFITVTILNTVLNLLLVQRFGAMGTSWIILVTEFLITAGLIYDMNRNPKTSIIKYVL